MNKIERSWLYGEYPFDYAGCGCCLSGHMGKSGCVVPSHEGLRKAAETLLESWKGHIIPSTEAHVQEATKVREEFARFYPGGERERL